MKKIVAILMAMLMVMSVTVVLAGGVATPKEKQAENDGQHISENEGLNVLGKEEFVTDEFIVKFKPGVGKEKIDKINSKHGASVRHTSPYTGTKRIAIPKGKTVAEMVKLYQAEDAVVYAEPNYIAYALMVPDDPLYSYQWHLDNADYGGIGMEEAWEIQTGAPSIVVAVIDTGVAYENYRQGRNRYYLAPDLANTNFVPGYDFVNDDTHPNDDNSHGTHAAGTIAQSTNNGVGVAGVAFNTAIMPVKVLDKSGLGYYSWIADGIRYATDNGAQVISLSLGGSADSEILKNAVMYAYENGVTVIAAAGNDASSTIGYPAAYDDYVIAVGATRYDETLAYYSNYGPSLDLVAPGGDVTVDQNGDGYGDGVLQNTFNPYTMITNDFGYWFFQGTSMATPHVSGVAAIVIANGNAITPNEVRSALQETAEDLGAEGRDDTYGYGLVDAYAALQWNSVPECTKNAECDDGQYCNGDETCVAGVCQPGTPVDCSGLSDPCNEGVCDESTDSCIAKPKPDGTACDDESFCTVNDQCIGGTCQSGEERDCSALTDQCNIGICDEDSDSCVKETANEGSPCDDGLFCTIEEVCTVGMCSGKEKDCSDGITCTIDSCNEGSDVCVNTPDNALCDNGFFCDGIETCDLSIGGCRAGTPVNCDDGNDCTTDSCIEDKDACEYTWRDCGLDDGCCGPECSNVEGNPNYDPDCAVAVKCWSADYQYLYRNKDQAKKFCRCATGTYGYNSYSYTWGWKTVYMYVDSGDNENWEVTSRSSYLPVYSVTCMDGVAYPTNVDYYCTE